MRWVLLQNSEDIANISHKSKLKQYIILNLDQLVQNNQSYDTIIFLIGLLVNNFFGSKYNAG